MLEKELTIAVLSADEELIGYIDSDEVKIIEYNELYNLRGIDITLPLNQTNDEYLKAGNKLYRPSDCDGNSMAYVILGEKEYNYKDMTLTNYAEELNTELSQYKVNILVNIFQTGLTFDSEWIDAFLSDICETGTVESQTVTRMQNTGLGTPLEYMRLLEAATDGEFQFRYELEENQIIRYVDLLDQIGTTHNKPIELGYNASNIVVKVDETNVRIAASPRIAPPDNNYPALNDALDGFSGLEVSTNVQIPLYVTKDENNNDVIGPYAYPPYNKSPGTTYVECDNSQELIADYQRIHAKPSNTPSSFPRIHVFDSSETNKYNIYWECVTNVREHLEPEVSISCNVIDLQKLIDGSSEYYNVGDTVYIRLPGKSNLISGRVIKTQKDPREPENDTIELGNYQSSYLKNMYKNMFKSAGSIII